MGECLIMRRGGETYKPAILNAAYPQDVSTTVIKGNTTSASFNVLIAEAGTPAEYTYQWYLDGVAVEGATESSYVVDGLGETAEHTVYCEVTNKGGVAQSRIATLSVTQYYTPKLNSSYPANVTGKEVGGSATFKVEIEEAGNPTEYTYQWYVNDSAVSGATGASYTRSGLAKGKYTVYCMVTNKAGTTVSRTATLTVTHMWLFDNGDDCTANTGGWSTYNYANGISGTYNYGTGVCTKNSGNFVLQVYPEQGIARQTKNKINLSNYSKIEIKLVMSGTKTYAHMDFFASSSSGAVATSGNIAAKHRAESLHTSTTTLTLDISSLSGSYYVGAGEFIWGGSAGLKTTVYSIRLI